MTRDAVVGLEIVTATGEIVRLGGRTTKDVAGYGLIPLIVGSQGTLALITEATLRLRPTPPPSVTLLAFFPSLTSAGDAVSALAAAGVEPCTLELMDRTTIRAVDDDHHLGLDRDAAAMLMIESDLPGSAASHALDVAEIACLGAGAISTIVAADPAEADLLRQARRLAFNSMERLGVARMEDVGVPRGRVPELLAEIERIGREQGLLIATFGHVGDGNLHPNIILDRDDPGRRGQAEQGDRRPLPGGDRPGRHGHRRARHRGLAARLPRAPARQRRGGDDARSRPPSTRWASSTPARSCRTPELVRRLARRRRPTRDRTFLWCMVAASVPIALTRLIAAARRPSSLPRARVTLGARRSATLDGSPAHSPGQAAHR